jgi:hypothetical protein
MGTQAIILMSISEAVITFLVIYFFVKVLRTKPNPEPDSYSDND